MSEIPTHIRHCILYEFQLGNSASTAARNICAALGDDAVADRTCRDWLNDSVKVTYHWKIVLDLDALWNLILNN